MLRPLGVAPALAETDSQAFLGALAFEAHRAIADAIAESQEPGKSGIAKDRLDRLAGALLLLSLADAGPEAIGWEPLDLSVGHFMAELPGLKKPAEGSVKPPGLGKKEIERLICFYVGADIAGRMDLARQAELSDKKARDCEKRFAKAAGDWKPVLDLYRIGTERQKQAGAGPLYVDIAPVLSERAEAITDILRQTNLLDRMADRFNGQSLLPRPAVLLVTECGGPDSFFNAARAEIVLCAERIGAWLDVFADQAPAPSQ